MKTVKKRLADGTERIYHYHRKTGARIDGEPGTREFLASLEAAGRIPTPAIAEALDIAWLIERYQASPEYTGLADATKATRRSYLKKIRARFAGAVLDFLDHEGFAGVLYEWRDELAPMPWTANHSLDTMGVLFDWARKRRHMRHNWAAEIERLPVRNRAEKIWTVELWRPLVAAATPDERELLEFAMLSGARQEDCASMAGTAYDGEWLTYTPQKTERRTGVVVQLPAIALPPLQKLLEERSRATEFLLCTGRGHPWTTSNIKLRMRDLKARAFPKRDPDRTFHDIRGTLASRLMDAGCTDAEAASIMGWVIGSRRGSGDRVAMTRNYVKRSQQLAINAYQRLYAADWGQIGNVVPLRASNGVTTEADNRRQPGSENGGIPVPHWNGMSKRD